MFHHKRLLFVRNSYHPNVFFNKLKFYGGFELINYKQKLANFIRWIATLPAQASAEQLKRSPKSGAKFQQSKPATLSGGGEIHLSSSE